MSSKSFMLQCQVCSSGLKSKVVTTELLHIIQVEPCPYCLKCAREGKYASFEDRTAATITDPILPLLEDDM